MDVLKIVVAQASVLDTRTLAALEACCKSLGADALWRRERMARAYADIEHGRWPSEIVGPPPMGKATLRVDQLWLDAYDKRRLPRNPDTLAYRRDAARVLALLRYVRDPCPKRARRRECDAYRKEHALTCDLSWEEATRDYIEMGYGSVALAREAYRLWEPYFRLGPADRHLIGNVQSRRYRIPTFVPPDVPDLHALASERREFRDWIKSLGECKVALRIPIDDMAGRAKIQACVDRERALVEAMRSRNLTFREDSVLGRLHVMTGERTVDELCDIAEEMAWYYGNGYNAAVKLYPMPRRDDVPYGERDAVAELDRVDVSELAKDLIVRNHMRYRDGVMPKGPLPVRVTARFERIAAEPAFEARSPWDD
jgi:hypothetical protein